MQPPPTIFKLSIKKKNYKILFCGGEGGGGEMEMPSQIRSNSLPWASKKLHCKGEPYRFSGERDPSLQTISLLLYILGYIFDCLSIYLFNCLFIYLFNCLSIYLSILQNIGYQYEFHPKISHSSLMYTVIVQSGFSEIRPRKGGRGQWAVCYTIPQSFIIMISYSFAQQLWVLFLELGLVGSLS